MIAMLEHKNFWDKNAGRYDRFMRKDGAAYDEMYALIQPIVRHKTVLELARYFIMLLGSMQFIKEFTVFTILIILFHGTFTTL